VLKDGKTLEKPLILLIINIIKIFILVYMISSANLKRHSNPKERVRVHLPVTVILVALKCNDQKLQNLF